MIKRRLTAALIIFVLLTQVLSCRAPFGGTPTPSSLPPIQPVLLEHSPARGEETPLDGSIVLVFDQPMDAASVEAAFRINPPVNGSFSWRDPTTVVFTPDEPWRRATRYQVMLDTIAKSAEGLSLRAEAGFSFITTGFLEVTQVIPAPDTMEVAPNAAVTVMFNRPVVPLQLVSAPTTDMPDPVTFDPPVEGSGEWVNTSIYVFRPSRGFTPGTTYHATVAAGLSDTTGGVLQEDFSWSFTIQAPYVLSTDPVDGARGVALNRPITVTFSQPMDRSSTQAAFSIEPNVPGRFSWSANDTVLTFIPEGLLELDTGYRIRVSTSARAAAGDANLRGGIDNYFRTVPPPAILSTIPADGNNNAPPDTSFTIRFASPMDVSTLLPNITILPEPTRVYTYWNDYDQEFNISWDIEPSTSYEVRLDGDMADPYGNRIGQDRVVRFTTDDLPPLAYLVVPGDVGVYSAYTNTTVYLVHRNVSQVDLALYYLDWADFSALTGPDRWQVWDSFTPDAENLIRQWSLPATAELNASRYLRAVLAEDGGALQPGLYFLEVSAPEVRRQQWGAPSRHILVVTRAHLTLKLAQREALVWATDIATGDPVAGLEVSLWSGPETMLASGVTDADGVFRTGFAPLADIWSPVAAVARDPTTGNLSGVTSSDWYSGIGPWDFGLSTEYAPLPYRLYAYTDRPIYRPGQPVYFRGVVRAEDDVHYSLPTGLRDVLITVRDDQAQVVYSTTLPLSDFGTFDGQFTLSDEASLGYYYIEARIGPAEQGQTGGVGFQVAEYHRPEFQVSITADHDEVLTGDRLNVTVEASYFFGGPVANAAVAWTLLSQDYAFSPDVPGWWDWSDTSRWDWWTAPEVPGWGNVIADGSGTTDARGRFTFSVPTDIAEAFFSQRFTIEATVTDVNDQSVSNRTSVIVHKGLFYIGMRPERYVGEVGEEQNVELRTVDWAGDPVRNVPLQVTFSRREWFNVQEEDEYGNLYWTWSPSDTLVFSQTVTTDRQGKGTASFVPEGGGTYIVRATGEDERGNTVASATWLWIASREYVSWRQENNDRITLIADQRSYRPGDVARILVPSPFQGEVTALFTVERGRIIRHWVQTLTSNAETIELPITADYAPNVFVSVVLVSGVNETNPAPAYRVGYVSFGVSPEEQELTITITPDRDIAGGEHYGPRETVNASVLVTDADGRPVAAEVSVAVVDKAVLSLAQPNAPAITEAFYGQRGLGVRLADNLSISVDRINVQVAREAKGGGGGGPEMAMGEGFIRQEFPDTAYWTATLRTDAQGRATLSFDLPDQLTTWHVDARAVTQSTLVGQTELEFLSTKDLLVRPVTPRFFVVGDRANLAAVVHNNTTQALEVEVWLDAEGVTLLGEARQRVTIAAGGRERVEWPVEVQDAEWAELTFYARGGGYSDAVRPPAGLPPNQFLPIYRYSAPEVVGTAGQLDEEGNVLEGVALPPSLDTTQGELTVRIEPSLAAGMVGGLDYLEHYPYECTEQVVSRFLPNILTFRALEALGLEDPDLESHLREQVGIGLARLYNRQHYDGGWGWWVNDDSDLQVSAYVVFGLVKAQEAGFAVDEQVLARGLGYLRQHVVSVSRLRSDEAVNRQAFVLYVLAEAGEASESALSNLYDLRGRLGYYGRAYLTLALSLVNPDDPRIETLLSDLSSAAILSATGAHWQEEEPGRLNWNTDTSTTALVLDVLARLDPENRLAPNAVRWLMHARSGDHWETTQETAWALIALTDWMVASGELEGEYTWGARVNGEDLGRGAVTPDTVRQVTEFRVAMADLLLGQTNRVEIARSAGPGVLYYTAHLHAFLPVEEVTALNRGVIVGRSYERADCQEDCEPISEARVGDVIRARLTIIAPHDLYYLIVEDPFPAGLEPIDVSLQTSSVVGTQPEAERVDVQQPWWWDWWGWEWFTDSDLRDEKLVLFATSLPAGTYEYTYLLQVGLAGEYRVLPAAAYEMYFPEVMGRADGMVFTVER